MHSPSCPITPSSIDSATHRLPSSSSELYAVPAGPILPWLPAYVSVASKNLWMAREPMAMGMGMSLRPRGTVIMGAFVYLPLCKSILERTRHRWDQYTSTVTLGQPSYSCDCSKILPYSFAQSASVLYTPLLAPTTVDTTAPTMVSATSYFLYYGAPPATISAMTTTVTVSTTSTTTLSVTAQKSAWEWTPVSSPTSTSQTTAALSSSRNASLSGGATAFIVILCLFFLVLAAVLAIFFKRRRRRMIHPAFRPYLAEINIASPDSSRPPSTRTRDTVVGDEGFGSVLAIGDADFGRLSVPCLVRRVLIVRHFQSHAVIRNDAIIVRIHSLISDTDRV